MSTSTPEARMRAEERETPPVYTLRARLLLREPGDVTSTGCVVVSGGRVVYAGRWLSRRVEGVVIDVPGGLITPGLINAHTHLHLTHLAGRMPHPRGFASWLFQIAPRVWRSSASLNRESVLEGAELCLGAGVTTVGAVVARWEAAPEHGRTRLRKVVFLEFFGLQPEEAFETIGKVGQRLAELPTGGLLTPAIAPHAPYSVCRELYEAAVRLAGRRGCLLSTHASESEAEREFLQAGMGELSTRFRMLARLPRGWKPPACSPIEVLARSGVLDTEALLVHCNYLSEEDTDLLARSKCRVVYCPRSAHYFHVREHPWQELRRRGVLVALGTDSLASSASLSILDEMHFLARRHPEVGPQELLAMGTTAGARALGLGAEVGVLRAGCAADLVVWDFPSVTPGEAVEALIWQRPAVRQSYVAGRRVWPPTSDTAEPFSVAGRQSSQ